MYDYDYWNNETILYPCQNEQSAVIDFSHEAYLMRVERRLGRKLTVEEAYRLEEQFKALPPATRRFIDRMTIPF